MTIYARTGSFVPDTSNTSRSIIVPFSPTHIRTFQDVAPPSSGSLTGTNRVILEWFAGMPSGSFFQRSEGGGSERQLQNGFYVTPFGPFELGPSKEGTLTTTSDNQSRVTLNNHGLSNGDVIRVTSIAGNKSRSGIDYTIGAVATNTFDILGMPLISGASAIKITYRKVNRRPLFGPAVLRILGFTPGTQTVVTVTPEYLGLRFSVDQIVRLRVPSGWGLSGVDGVAARIVSITPATTATQTTAKNTSTLGLQLTLDYDSTGAGTFAFPADSAARVSPAQVVPVGQVNFSSNSAFTNVAQQGALVVFGSRIQPSTTNNGSRVVYWEILGYPREEVQTVS